MKSDATDFKLVLQPGGVTNAIVLQNQSDETVFRVSAGGAVTAQYISLSGDAPWDTTLDSGHLLIIQPVGDTQPSINVIRADASNIFEVSDSGRVLGASTKGMR